MKIIIAAGTGFLGKNLEQYFLNKNYEVKILTRNPNVKTRFSGTPNLWKFGKTNWKIPMFSSISLENLWIADTTKRIKKKSLIPESIPQKCSNKQSMNVKILQNYGLMQVLQLFTHIQKRISIQRKTESSATISQ